MIDGFRWALWAVKCYVLARVLASLPWSSYPLGNTSVRINSFGSVTYGFREVG